MFHPEHLSPALEHASQQSASAFSQSDEVVMLSKTVPFKQSSWYNSKPAAHCRGTLPPPPSPPSHAKMPVSGSGLHALYSPNRVSVSTVNSVYTMLALPPLSKARLAHQIISGSKGHSCGRSKLLSPNMASPAASPVSMFVTPV